MESIKQVIIDMEQHILDVRNNICEIYDSIDENFKKEKLFDMFDKCEYIGKMENALTEVKKEYDNYIKIKERLEFGEDLIPVAIEKIKSDKEIDGVDMVREKNAIINDIGVYNYWLAKESVYNLKNRFIEFEEREISTEEYIDSIIREADKLKQQKEQWDKTMLEVFNI